MPSVVTRQQANQGVRLVGCRCGYRETGTGSAQPLSQKDYRGRLGGREEDVDSGVVACAKASQDGRLLGPPREKKHEDGKKRRGSRVEEQGKEVENLGGRRESKEWGRGQAPKEGWDAQWCVVVKQVGERTSRAARLAGSSRCNGCIWRD